MRILCPLELPRWPPMYHWPSMSASVQACTQRSQPRRAALMWEQVAAATAAEAAAAAALERQPRRQQNARQPGARVGVIARRVGSDVASPAEGAGVAGARPRESRGEGFAQADNRGRRHAPLRRRAGFLPLPQPPCTAHVLTPRMRRRRRYWRSWKTISCSAGHATRRATASGC